MASSLAECIGQWKPTQGTETSKYLQERKSNETPLVAASESGTAQTQHLFLSRDTVMFYVYVLVEKGTEDTYIGYTSDLKQRIAKHNAGAGAKTTKHGEWRLAYYEAYICKKDAINRERKLKQHGQSRAHLFQRIKNSLESTGQK